MLIFIALIFNLTFVKAQNVNIGFKGGINVSNFNTSGYEKIPGFHIGLFTELLIKDRYSLQPELLYSTQGSSKMTMGKEAVTNLNYVDLPIMIKYRVLDNFNIEIGPEFGFLISEKTHVDGKEIDTNDNFEDLDFGLNIGIAYSFESIFDLGVRYNYGFSEINAVKIDDKIKNEVIQLSFGIKL